MVLRMLLAAVLLSPALAQAQPSDQAIADSLALISARAKVAFESEQYLEAVGLYQEAYRLEPVSTLLYNIAFIYDTYLDDRVLARDFYRRYVNAPDAEQSARLKSFERIALFDAMELSAAARPVSAPPGAAVPAAPATVAPPVAAVPVAVAPVTAVPAVAPVAGVPPASVQPGVGARVEPSDSKKTVSIVLLGLGGAALVTSGIATAVVADTHDDYLAARTPSRRKDLSASGETQALVADLSLVLGVSAVAVGVWLLLSDDDAATSWMPAPVNGEPGVVFGHRF